MKSVLIDTNAILRFLLNDVPSQFRLVKNLIKNAKNGKLMLIVPEVVIFETFFVLSAYYKYSKGKITEMLESLISSDYFEIESKIIFSKSLNIYKLESMSLVDSFLAARSKNDNVGIFTFDKKLEKYAKNS